MKKVLIISYYWPPAGGGGVQRWLKMTKFLPDLGWKPIIATPSNGEAPVIDESLLKEVHTDVETVKIPIWEPYGFYKKFTGKKKGEKVYSGFISDKKEGIAQKLSVFIRGNFFIPDARKFWIRPARKALVRYLKDNPVDAIISTGPPHTTHLIAYGITRKINVPWVADFRDPWTNIDFYDQLRLTKWADRKHRRLEQLVLKNATQIVTVSQSWSKDFVNLSKGREIKVITNGFDHLDFERDAISLDTEFSICHIGSMNKDRNTPALWEALKKLKSDDQFKAHLSIKLIGQVDHSIFKSIEEFGLTEHLNHIPFLPHSEAVKHLQTSQLLLLPINDTPNSMGVIPGKLFEYMGAQRPIICIGPKNGDSAAIVSNSGAGAIFGYDEVEELKAHLSASFKAFTTGDLTVNASGVMNYSRKELAKKYSLLLQDLI